MSNTKQSTKKQAPSWRDTLPIHPAADLFPLMNPEELRGLAEDIAGHRNPSHAHIDLKFLPVLFVDADDKISLLDGRNRLDAMELLGWRPCFVKGLKAGAPRYSMEFWHLQIRSGPVTFYREQVPVCHSDPYGTVLSFNIHRRHLTAEQKRELIGKLLKAQPEKSNRQIAETVKASHVTVGAVRTELERRGQIDHVATHIDTKGRNQPAAKSKPAGNSIDPQASADQRKAEAQQADTPEPATAPPQAARPALWLPTHEGELVAYPQPRGKATFNDANEQISWAAWTWNPVTGCLHGCKYCYARELANKPSYRDNYPAGFTPLFHHQRLDAPRNKRVPKEAASDPRLKRVFVCSMADLYGKWVPDDWIERVHASCIDNPQWDYLLLTKFPRRYVGLKLPPTAWVGTSVDEQKRVRLAEEAFRQIKDVRVKWLSLEPLLAPLEFTDLSMFDWVVIGSQSATEQPDGPVKEFAPPIKWVCRLIDQAHEAGCAVYCKPNLLGVTNPQSPGMTLPQEAPAAEPEPQPRKADEAAK